MTNLTTMNQTQTMSSREIAELTGKEHKNVLRDIDKLTETLSSDLSLGFKSTTYEDSTGKSNRMFELDKNATICLVAGYDANLRMKIINRWQELEQVTQVIANNLGMTKQELLEDIKLDTKIEAERVKQAALKDKALASQLKLQALRDKLAKQSEVLNAKTAAILARGAKVKGDMVVGKLDLPTDCITELLKQHGSEIEPKLANWALRKLGYLTTDNKVTELGLPFGKTIKSSPKAKTTLARWYVNEFSELLKQVTELYDKEFNI